MTHKWTQITPLDAEDQALDLPDIAPLYESWHDFRKTVEKTKPQLVDDLLEKILRRLSIETGILERIYDLDRGTTNLLIEKGFEEDLVARSSTDTEPSALVEILKDQRAAIELVHDVVAGSRPLTKCLIREIHSIITQHQKTTDAVDHLGKRVKVPLLRGAFKKHPNNPTRQDGSSHEYCPPEHVESEIDNLLSWYEDYNDVDPLIVAAWLHHRFTQIHPFQDGNGRVSRVLLTLVLLKSKLLPVVIDRDQRGVYIEALEKADMGELSHLVGLLGDMEKRAIVTALSIDTTAEAERQVALSEAVISSLAAKFNRRKKERRADFLQVNDIAMEFRAAARKQIERTLSALCQQGFIDMPDPPRPYVADGGPDRDNAHWYRSSVISMNDHRDAWINFEENHYFVKATVRYLDQRLVFIVSLHHVGRELAGVMEATAFAQLQTYSDERQDQHDELAGTILRACELEPFVFTWRTSSERAAPAFRSWLDACLAVGMKEWGDRL